MRGENMWKWPYFVVQWGHPSPQCCKHDVFLPKCPYTHSLLAPTHPLPSLLLTGNAWQVPRSDDRVNTVPLHPPTPSPHCHSPGIRGRSRASTSLPPTRTTASPARTPAASAPLPGSTYATSTFAGSFEDAATITPLDNTSPDRCVAVRGEWVQVQHPP